MSLNKEQRRITAIELREHFHNSNLNIEDIANKMRGSNIHVIGIPKREETEKKIG